jgi:hypothetical protein
MACAICEIRRPRRFCPGVRGDICTLCCGTEREVTVDCPLDCEYLAESRKREKRQSLAGKELPNRDIRVTEKLLQDNQELLDFLSITLVKSALEAPVVVVDSDVREALDGLIRTYRTLQSGVYYESMPANPLAAGIFSSVQNALAEFRREEPRRLGMTRTRDADILGILVYFQHFEIDRNNGRRRGRAFLHALRAFYPAVAGSAEPASSLILP